MIKFLIDLGVGEYLNLPPKKVGPTGIWFCFTLVFFKSVVLIQSRLNGSSLALPPKQCSRFPVSRRASRQNVCFPNQSSTTGKPSQVSVNLTGPEQLACNPFMSSVHHAVGRPTSRLPKRGQNVCFHGIAN